MRMLDLGSGPAPNPPVEGRPVMVISTGQMNDGRRKAPSNGTYTLNGGKFFINAGDPLPDGAEFVAKGDGELAGGKKAADAPAEEAAATDETDKVKTGRRGPTATTDAVGPTETT